VTATDDEVFDEAAYGHTGNFAYLERNSPSRSRSGTTGDAPSRSLLESARRHTVAGTTSRPPRWRRCGTRGPPLLRLDSPLLVPSGSSGDTCPPVPPRAPRSAAGSTYAAVTMGAVELDTSTAAVVPVGALALLTAAAGRRRRVA
jgi:hypothetical protein